MDENLYYAMLHDKQRELERRETLEYRKIAEENQRHQELISARHYELQQRNRYDAEREAFRSRTQFELEEIRNRNERDLVRYELEADKELERMRQDLSVKLEYIRQNGNAGLEKLRQDGRMAEVHHVSETNLELERMRQVRELAVEKSRADSAYSLEKFRQESILEHEAYKSRVALELENKRREAALELENASHRSRMVELFMGFCSSTFHKIMETRANRTNSLLKRLEDQANLNDEIFKMGIAYLLRDNNDSSRSASEAVEEVLKRWKGF